jgi:hypothetical protein
MASGGSIPMFLWPRNRLQPLILLPNHHVTHFGHTLLRAVAIFSQKKSNIVTCATMASGDSIPMFLGARNRLQFSVLPPDLRIVVMEGAPSTIKCLSDVFSRSGYLKNVLFGS